MSESETLAQFVVRVMQQKNFKISHVIENCGGKLSGSYISRVATGRITNPTVEAILALAEGLQVSPYEVFAAACPVPSDNPGVEAALLLDTMGKLIASPHLIRVLQELSKLSRKHQTEVLKSLKLVNGKSKKDSDDKKE